MNETEKRKLRRARAAARTFAEDARANAATSTSAARSGLAPTERAYLGRTWREIDAARATLTEDQRRQLERWRQAII